MRVIVGYGWHALAFSAAGKYVEFSSGLRWLLAC